jgi:hypothetical protein
MPSVSEPENAGMRRFKSIFQAKQLLQQLEPKLSVILYGN